MPIVDSGAAVPAPNQELCTVTETVVRIGEQLPYAIAILSAPEFHYEYINSHYQALAPGKVYAPPALRGGSGPKSPTNVCP